MNIYYVEWCWIYVDSFYGFRFMVDDGWWWLNLFMQDVLKYLMHVCTCVCAPKEKELCTADQRPAPWGSVIESRWSNQLSLEATNRLVHVTWCVGWYLYHPIPIIDHPGGWVNFGPGSRSSPEGSCSKCWWCSSWPWRIASAARLYPVLQGSAGGVRVHSALGRDNNNCSKHWNNQNNDVKSMSSCITTES